MTDTEAALLAAIAAMPDEDTPRLVYADYLDERGGEAAAARAEFIRLQVMLSQVEPDADEAADARLRAGELCERFADAWGFPPAGDPPWYAVRRGFVGELVIDFPRAPRAEILHLLSAEPVGRLRVVRPCEAYRGWWDVPAGWSAEATWLDVPALRKVAHLELVGSYWTDRELSRFLALANFPAPTALALTRVPITGAGVAAVVSCERLGGLTSLRVDDTRQWVERLKGCTGGVPLPGVRALASAARLAGLRELSLRAAGIETAGAFLLADSPHLGGLTAPGALDLTDNPGIGPAGRKALIDRFGGALRL